MMGTSGDRDEHIIEAIGKCRITIRNGSVVEVGEPIIRECPLARRFAHPVHNITADAVRENIEHRIRSFGMCTDHRQIEMSGDFVGFGASELLSFGIREGLLDAIVLVCDGAGTVIAHAPGLVQGIGGRMSGLVKTTPLPGVISAIERAGGTAIDPLGAQIDQIRGVVKAYAAGYRKVAVTIVAGREGRIIREQYPQTLIIAVHTSGISTEQARELAEVADIITACASSAVREVASTSAILQAGSAIPVFAMTRRGKDLILEKVRNTDSPIVIFGSPLPFQGDRTPQPLV